MIFDLIHPAIIVFLLMVVGLVLTTIEFNKLNREESEGNDRAGADRGKK